MDKELEKVAVFATSLAKKGGEVIMQHYKKPELEVIKKPDGTPVTLADQQTEAFLRAHIEKAFPQHQILGEEEGLSGPKESTYKWVLDPIDGTIPFIHRIPLFTSLIALLREGKPVLGIIFQPVLEELMLGVEGRPTTLNGREVRVSQVKELQEAKIAYTCLKNLKKRQKNFPKLVEKAALLRGWGDAYGHMMVACGRMDVMIDPQMQPWDIAPIRPCVEGAGGRMTDLSGERMDIGKNALSTNKHLHGAILEELQG